MDTNVISEARKGVKANFGVRKFWQTAREEDIYLSAISIGELRRGIENLKYRGDLLQATKLEAWLLIVCGEYAKRILDFDADCAQVWGKLMSPHNHNAVDKQIAATALIHDLTVVTRNIDDFQGTGVLLTNPFE
ncbi:type II toxin-antitoxin system VapC family toxin [Paludibacterium purpuratum]|uniref:type II toxin-antitoxin system VapC family toxin n=1 Tax=Paludibacterium purpuratum TaxID=1144873 RepID=UPI001FB77896|nr:type II toxin-antitoxin system VapC family toxin [Paludibacterium purpuratum]